MWPARLESLRLKTLACSVALPRIEREDLGEVDERVACHGESELGLARLVAAHAGNEESRGVENGSERADPALVGVLRAVVTKERGGDVAFKQLCRPALPFGEECGELVFGAFE